MATTDTRSGFRLPWNSDRSHDQQPSDEPAAEPVAEGDGSEAVSADDENVAWPSTDFNSRLGLTSQPRPAEAFDTTETTDTDAPEEVTMLEPEVAPAPAKPAPKKPSKLMADVSAAIRATTETARELALTQVDADVAKVVEEIRAGSKEGEDALKVRSDEDIAAIREWSRGEIARIKSETDGRIDDRKSTLAAELDAHAGAIAGRVAEVEGTADAYRADMAAYAERLSEEEDPSLLATMVESMPEPPSLEALADLGNLAWAIPEPVVEPEPEPEPEAVLETVEAEPETAEPQVEATAEAEATAEPVAEFVDGHFSDGSEELPADAEATPEPVEAVAPDVAPSDETPAPAEWVSDAAPEPVRASDWGEPAAGGPWGEEGTTWHAAGTAVATDDSARWAAGETPDGFPSSGEEGGDPVDRGAIMAALEAAAEAVVAAESAAESAGQAEAAADVAETAAELLKGRVGSEDEVDPEAAAAMAARVDAGGVEESYTDRLAKLLPNHVEPAGDGEPRTTQVVVAGLVSVASIASFKRHLGRIHGVKSVTVASGPEGEFLFSVNHAADVSFRDALPTMPGFAARVTGTADGTINVTARDPEAEG